MTEPVIDRPDEGDKSGGWIDWDPPDWKVDNWSGADEGTLDGIDVASPISLGPS